MILLKCKMCGGDMLPEEGQSYGKCDTCGTFSALPKLDNEQIVNVYNRANELRLQNDFYAAQEIYENIITQTNNEPEAHWGAMLCKYGITYVIDPKTNRKAPICNRMSFNNILQDFNYLEALKNTSDENIKKLYMDEAKYISHLQRLMISVVQKEEHYDVFICYNQINKTGAKTVDSAEAQKIYDGLIAKGYKVFFSEITLEDKKGGNNEPYIFAALNHSKVMLAVGTSKENFENVWVKNEWGRYLDLCENDKTKVFVPCYKNINKNELPEKFLGFQTLDMSQNTFPKELINIIDKVFKRSDNQMDRSNLGGNDILDRAFSFLATSDINNAKECFNKALESNPNSPRAYIGLLCIDLNIKKESDLKTLNNFFWNENNFQKAYNLSNNEYKAILMQYVNAVKETHYLDANEMAQDNSIDSLEYAIKILNTILDYKDAAIRVQKFKSMLNFAKHEEIYENSVKLATTNVPSDLLKAIRQLNTIPNYKDSNQLAINYNAEYIYLESKNLVYNALSSQDDDYQEVILAYDEAIRKLNNIINYKDARQLSLEYDSEISYLKIFNTKKTTINEFQGAIASLQMLTSSKDAVSLITKYEKQVAKLKFKQNSIKTVIITSIIAVVLCVGIGIFNFVYPLVNYNKAEEFYSLADYENALLYYGKNEEYKDSKDKIDEVHYVMAGNFNASGDYKNAISYYSKNEEYKDSLPKINDIYFAMAEGYYAGGDYKNAISYFEQSSDYKNAGNEIKMASYAFAEQLNNEKNYLTALFYYNKAYDYEDAKSKSRNLIEYSQNSIVAGDMHTVGLQNNGKVVAVGYNDNGQCDVSSWSGITSISAGRYHTVGLKEDKTVVAVGWNMHEQLNVTSWTDIIQVSNGETHTVGLKSNGTVVAVGDNSYGQCGVSSWTNIVAISADKHHTIGLKSNGTVVAVGNNFNDSNWSSIISNWTNIISIAAGKSHVVGLKSDGTIVTVGYNLDVSAWSNIVSISAGETHTVGLKSDGTVIAVGNNNSDVSSWTDIVSISDGANHIIGLKIDGTVIAVGNNDNGQCGTSNWADIGRFYMNN